MKELGKMKFSKSYSKLNYPIFTTIRQDKGYYKVGQIINVNTPETSFEAEILAIRELSNADITENMARVDADCSKQKLQGLMNLFYREKAEELILLTLAKIL